MIVFIGFIFSKKNTSEVECINTGSVKYEFSNKDYHYFFCHPGTWEVTGGADKYGRPDIYLRGPNDHLVIKLELFPREFAEMKSLNTYSDDYFKEKRNKVITLVDNSNELFQLERSTPVNWWVPTIYMKWYLQSVYNPKDSFYASVLFDEDNTDAKDVLEMSNVFSTLRETFKELPLK